MVLLCSALALEPTAIECAPLAVVGLLPFWSPEPNATAFSPVLRLERPIEILRAASAYAASPIATALVKRVWDL